MFARIYHLRFSCGKNVNLQIFFSVDFEEFIHWLLFLFRLLTLLLFILHPDFIVVSTGESVCQDLITHFYLNLFSRYLTSCILCTLRDLWLWARNYIKVNTLVKNQIYRVFSGSYVRTYVVLVGNWTFLFFCWEVCTIRFSDLAQLFNWFLLQNFIF